MYDSSSMTGAFRGGQIGNYLYMRDTDGSGSGPHPYHKAGNITSSFAKYSLNSAVPVGSSLAPGNAQPIIMRNPHIDRTSGWIIGSWIADGVLPFRSHESSLSISGIGQTVSPTDGRLDLFDSRFPMKRLLGWCYFTNFAPNFLRSSSSQDVWGYVQIRTTDLNNPEIWIYFSSPGLICKNFNTGQVVALTGWVYVTFNMFCQVNDPIAGAAANGVPMISQLNSAGAPVWYYLYF